MATGGAIGIVLAVIKVTNWPILSKEGALENVGHVLRSGRADVATYVVVGDRE